jgi:hypothetical protein
MPSRNQDGNRGKRGNLLGRNFCLLEYRSRNARRQKNGPNYLHGQSLQPLRPERSWSQCSDCACPQVRNSCRLHASWRAAPRKGRGGLQAKYIDVQFGRQEILRCPREGRESCCSGIRFEFSISGRVERIGTAASQFRPTAAGFHWPPPTYSVRRRRRWKPALPDFAVCGTIPSGVFGRGGGDDCP